MIPSRFARPRAEYALVAYPAAFHAGRLRLAFVTPNGVVAHTTNLTDAWWLHVHMNGVPLACRVT